MSSHLDSSLAVKRGHLRRTEYDNALRGVAVADDGLMFAVLPIVPFLRKVGSAVRCHGACLSGNALPDLAFMSLSYYGLFLFCKYFQNFIDKIVNNCYNSIIENNNY